ncbi:hypothetical protein CHARACLAT_025631 [Characodon lateralis]|uniref:Uncharacterized protein n=1 Tax=Characodon lateralis TaxID=208331 RepID=A0ABU7D0T1_9TELE|nr:hypothetical protein [Characodon lateralis]
MELNWDHKVQFFIFFPSLNRHINVVEGFECSNDPRGYVVWGLNAPGRVSHGKQALGDGSDKERHVTLPGTAEPGSHPGARPGVGTRRRVPGGLVAPRGTIPQWAHHLQGKL